MAVLPIKKLPDQVLREPAREITEINGELQRLIDDMAETMYAAPGLGLAANQVGGLHRLIVFDVTHRDGGARDLKVIINPCITRRRGIDRRRVASRWRILPPRCGATPG